jgi:GT2 family glycosyltransferase
LSLQRTLARLAAALRPKWHQSGAGNFACQFAPGISVVIPSRNGRALLETCLPTIASQSFHLPVEIIVVDNGSDDATPAWLSAHYPAAHAILSPTPLSFARAVNLGIAAASCSHVCLLNNDMLLEPGFFAALWHAFDAVPDLFCATAQILFPPGVRREETGKAVMAQSGPDDFPVRCDEPLPGEDLTWVLYGSGGCSLYDAAKLRALGNVDEAYEPAYVEDLDLGWRAWQQGWPTVYVAGAVVEHRHRATTSRYYTAAELERVLEVNYLKFLVRAVDSRPLFLRLWTEALDRLIRAGRAPAPLEAAAIALEGGRLVRVQFREEDFLAVTDGSVAVFPGEGSGVGLLACPKLEKPPSEMLCRYAAVVVVRGTTESLAFRTARSLAARRWPGAISEVAAPLPARPDRTTSSPPTISSSSPAS